MLVLLSSGSVFVLFFFFKQKTAYEMRISDWSSDVCSSDLLSAGSGLGPRVTAQLLRTPSISRRKSQCSRVASCFCTMKRSPLALALFPRGSAVLVKSRLALSRLRGSAASATGQAFFRLGAGFSSPGCFSGARSEEQPSELPSPMPHIFAVFYLT